MEKEYICLTGESDMGNFIPLWESHLPSYLILYCRQGEAKIQLLFEPYTMKKGHLAIITPDMFPAFTARSADFRAFYCLMDREFAEYTAYGVPNKFFDCQFSCPDINGGQDMDTAAGTCLHPIHRLPMPERNTEEHHPQHLHRLFQPMATAIWTCETKP